MFFFLLLLFFFRRSARSSLSLVPFPLAAVAIRVLLTLLLLDLLFSARPDNETKKTQASRSETPAGSSTASSTGEFCLEERGKERR